MSIYRKTAESPNDFDKFNVIQVKIPLNYFKNQQTNSTVYIEKKDSLSQTILKNIVQEQMLYNLDTHYKGDHHSSGIQMKE